ncbi:MAG: hypothetical protein ACYDBW_04450 [Sulfuricaulis sp.]
MNLNAVVRSLKDLIGNELDISDRPALEENLKPPQSEESILQGTVESLAPQNDEPGITEPDEIELGDEHASTDEDLTPPLPDDDILENISKNFAPREEEPRFEEPDEIDFGDALTVPAGNLKPSLSDEDILESAANALTPPNEEPTFEEADITDIEDDLAFPEDSASAEQSAMEKTIPEEFAPMEARPASNEMAPAAPSTPEPAADISRALHAESPAASPATSKKSAAEENVPGMQQELPFDVSSPFIVERQPPSRSRTRQMESPPELAVKKLDRESYDEPAASDSVAAPVEALPTIEVEETFDENAYFDVEAPLAENSPLENNFGVVIETPATPAGSTSEKTETARPESLPASEIVPAPNAVLPDTGLELKTLDETDAESSRPLALVDFHGVDLAAPSPKPDPSSMPAETTPATIEPPQAGHNVQSMTSIDFDAIGLEAHRETQAPTPVGEPPAAVESIPEVTMTKKPDPDEDGHEKVREPAKEEARDDKPARSTSTRKKRATAVESDADSGAPSETPMFNLNDIPVLREVVAPPSGSKLAPLAAPLPASDRARDIVVRAVAKLNVELRKSGGAGLDTKTILRLQKLIRQEMEKDGKK